MYQNKWTALHWAVDRGHNDIVYMLIEAGADAGKKNMVSRHLYGIFDLLQVWGSEKRKIFSTLAFNSFTAPACKMSSLKGSHPHACKQYIFHSYNKFTFDTVYFRWKSFHVLIQKKTGGDGEG